MSAYLTCMMKKRFLDGLLTESVWFTKQETSVCPSEGAVRWMVPHLHPLPYLGLPKVGEEAKDPWLLEYYWETFHTGQPYKGLNTEYMNLYSSCLTFCFHACKNLLNWCFLQNKQFWKVLLHFITPVGSQSLTISAFSLFLLETRSMEQTPSIRLLIEETILYQLGNPLLFPALFFASFYSTYQSLNSKILSGRK